MENGFTFQQGSKLARIHAKAAKEYKDTPETGVFTNPATPVQQKQRVNP